MLRWLHALGEVTSKDITGALKSRDDLVSEIRRQLEALELGATRFLPGPEGFHPQAPLPPRRKPSAKARAAWKAQGRYMVAVRRQSKADRVKVKAIRDNNGVAAAIAAAKKRSR